jgi:large subunit ribosomal protein L22
MISKAKVSYIRMSPRKIRYVLDIIRNLPVSVALSVLDRTNARPCETLSKLILQAADSAKKQKNIDIQRLYVSRVYADGAGMLKRFRSMSMGRAGMIRKRMSHVCVELELIQPKQDMRQLRAPRRFSIEPSRRDPVLESQKKKSTKKLAGATR